MNRKMNAVKRIAFVANDSNRKALIEWSYTNKEILKHHELIAMQSMADILEGTMNAPVTKLPEGAVAANQELAGLIKEQQIDILLFFWEPAPTLQAEAGIRVLHDMAMANNIVVACNLATADFVLGAELMHKPHSVPVKPQLQYVLPKNGHTVDDTHPRRVALKLNAIH